MVNKYKSSLIWVRGAGELGSAVALTLFRVGFQVILTERAVPLAIRRAVTFSDAVFEGESAVEEVIAVRCEASKTGEIIALGKIPLIVTEFAPTLSEKIHAVVDARMIKDASVSKPYDVPWQIGLGPGFEVGRNCDAVIETQRGHDLGRVLWQGEAAANSGIPGEIGGISVQRVVYSPVPGQILWAVNFGDLVVTGQVLGTLNDAIAIKSPISGTVRGLISPRVTFDKNVKIADVDPRGEAVAYNRISEKSRNVARGVLEALLILQKTIQSREKKLSP